MAWFDAEVPVLLTLIGYADANGFDSHAWQLPWALGPFIHRRGRWHDNVPPSGLRWPQPGGWATPSPSPTRITCWAMPSRSWATSRRLTPNFRQALDLFRALGDRANEAMVLNGLGGMLEKQERYPEALAVALDALQMLKAAGHWWTQARSENGERLALRSPWRQYEDALTHASGH